MLLFLSPVNYFRKKQSTRYPERFIQGVDYRRLNRKGRRNRKGHKYEMLRKRCCSTSIYGLKIIHEFFSVNRIGLMTINSLYRWDGPSGPTIDTASFMRGSAAHDVWFQICRELKKMLENAAAFEGANEAERKRLSKEGMIFLSKEWEGLSLEEIRLEIFNSCNYGLRDDCTEDGMLWPRYNWVYWAVQKRGHSSAGF